MNSRDTAEDAEAAAATGAATDGTGSSAVGCIFIHRMSELPSQSRGGMDGGIGDSARVERGLSWRRIASSCAGIVHRCLRSTNTYIRARPYYKRCNGVVNSPGRFQWSTIRGHGPAQRPSTPSPLSTSSSWGDRCDAVRPRPLVCDCRPSGRDLVRSVCKRDEASAV